MSQQKTFGMGTTHEPPRDAVAAVVHPDPYPYYAGLVARGGMFRDEKLGLWVATRAVDVEAALTNPLCRVRPPAEPVPKALQGAAGGEVFGRLVRMTDGAGQQRLKHAVGAAFGALTEADLAPAADSWARKLASDLPVSTDRTALQQFLFTLPECTMAALLGVPDKDIRRVAAWGSDLARSFAPGAGTAEAGRGNEAAVELQSYFAALLKTQRSDAGGGLLARLVREAAQAGVPEADTLANSVGFLFQAHDATAGLIGLALRALAAPEGAPLRPGVEADLVRLTAFVREVARYDSPTHNTRRFVAESGRVGGQAMHAGDTILVVLAAANRDPAVGADVSRLDPARYAPGRPLPRSFSFGIGPHACPGELLAVTIARAGVAALLQAGVDVATLSAPARYLASVNIRIPDFTPS